jgi:hypothetical protein
LLETVNRETDNGTINGKVKEKEEMNECVSVPVMEKETISKMSQDLTITLAEVLDEIRSLKVMVGVNNSDNEEKDSVPDSLFSNAKINLQKTRIILNELRSVNELM